MRGSHFRSRHGIQQSDSIQPAQAIERTYRGRHVRAAGDASLALYRARCLPGDPARLHLSRKTLQCASGSRFDRLSFTGVTAEGAAFAKRTAVLIARFAE